MTDEKNMFGGKNPHGLYVPMTEDEQEVLQRLIETQDLQLIIHGWATLDNPHIIFGDLRVGLPFNLTFRGPIQTISYLDLELKRQNGQTIFKQRQMVHPPITVGEGIEVQMQWDIAIDHMDPDFVKQVKPGAVGLTSRRLDKETGERTLEGNMDVTEKERQVLAILDDDADKVKKMRDAP